MQVLLQWRKKGKEKQEEKEDLTFSALRETMSKKWERRRGRVAAANFLGELICRQGRKERRKEVQPSLKSWSVVSVLLAYPLSLSLLSLSLSPRFFVLD